MSKIIALCGWPKSGKSLAAEILSEVYGGVIVDDGMILRQAVPILFHGVAFEDMLTQEGKLKTYEVLGKTYTYRQLLGYLGQVLEDFFGEHFIPEQTVRKIETMPEAPFFILPSVRKTQGQYYRAMGAEVWEIDRDVPASENAFDQWDKDAVTRVIRNRNIGLKGFENNVLEAYSERLGTLLLAA